MLSLKTHNVIDYIIAATLIAIPFLFGFSNIPTARNIFLVLGGGLATYSLITKYYYCLARIVPIGVHMTFDASAGLVLIAAPFAFGYRDALTTTQFTIHMIMGLGALSLVAITKTKTENSKTVEEKAEINRMAHHKIRHA
ncbi:MAG TPA: hypothetical protein VNJ01_01700 [Bacteriovoracaceae bacterium]|nr:hypothetical protein [Bacteriovoracaceae bacterium]